MNMPAQAPQAGEGIDRYKLAVPAELRDLPQWVVWKYERDPRRAKPKKVPVCPRSGSNASSTNPQTWGSFADAVACCEGGAYEGVGFVFSADDPYCGIDLDKCVSGGGADVNEFASELIERMGSYAELSPSGTGVHIIVKAVLPGRGRKTAEVEIYDRGRFFTVTGLPIGTPCQVIAERQAEVEGLLAGLGPHAAKPVGDYTKRQLCGPELPDETVLGLIDATKRRKRFRALFGGQWEKDFGSQSEADLALVGIIADFVGNNPGQIDRLFRCSKLCRPKWDEHRGELTYGEKTINKAMGEEQ